MRLKAIIGTLLFAMGLALPGAAPAPRALESIEVHHARGRHDLEASTRFLHQPGHS
jgi:hypothetical protein